MNKNIIKKITATALCGVLALTSVVTANSAVKVKAVTDVGKSFTLADGQLGATAFNLDSNDSVYAELRKEKGYTQVKMQLLTGIDQSDYSKIENGKRYYTFEQCRKIALALETSMDYLAGLTDEKKPYPRIIKK